MYLAEKLWRSSLGMLFLNSCDCQRGMIKEVVEYIAISEV